MFLHFDYPCFLQSLIDTLVGITVTNHVSSLVINSWGFRIATPPCPRAVFTPSFTSFAVKFEMSL